MVTVPAKVPVIAGEENMCSAGGLATLSISYESIGYNAGLMAYDILVNGKILRICRFSMQTM